MGLSSSAALLMATKGSIPPALLNISGIIPLTQTIFLWESIITAAVLLTISVLIAYWSAPSPENAKTVDYYGVKFDPINVELEPRKETR